MSVEHMPDQRLAHFYENIRQQVEADRASKHQLVANPTVRQCADKRTIPMREMKLQMIKRRLQHSPIEWPPEPLSIDEMDLQRPEWATERVS